MEYFNLTQEEITILTNEIGKRYQTKSIGSDIYLNLREKLRYLGKRLGKELGLKLINNYNEKPNKQAGRGKGFVLKEYILAGFIPEKYFKKTGEHLFIKVVFRDFTSSKPYGYLGFDIDVNFSKENRFNKERDRFQKLNWSIGIDQLPNNWDDLLSLAKQPFKRMIDYLDTYFDSATQVEKMQEYTDLLKTNKNLILTGVPGTGKTYLAKAIAKAMEAEMELVQFHPSYDYTDFVEGLRPTQQDGATLGFELKDGIFKQLCKRAIVQKEKDFVIIIDEINRAEISKVFGELFFSIDPGYRGVKGTVKTQYSNLQKDTDIFKNGFYIPENVYILGTMNDIDRSVESFDFAMRRRFAWKEISALDRLSMWDGEIDDWKEKAKTKIKALNSKIEQIHGLGNAYHIGPAYFLKLKSYNGDFEKLWENHLKGLLFEYLRGLPESKEQLVELKKAFDSELEAK